MTAPIKLQIEQRLEFEFQSGWKAVKWDDDAAFRKGLARCSDAKAIDVLATYGEHTPYLIEVKDPRGYKIQYRDAMTADELAALVAAKVRDTIAGLVYAQDREKTDHVLVHLKSLLRDRTTRPWVILWLEGIEADPPFATTLTSLIEKKLSWLKPKVWVTSRKLWKGRELPGMSVRSLSGAPWSG